MRRPLALLLVLAFIAALTTPVRASWSCANGSACVHDAAGFICPGKQCAVKGSCCKAKKVVCKHGALPGSGPRSTHRGYEAPDDCRFDVVGRPHLTGKTEAAVSIQFTFAMLPAAPAVRISRPVARPTWQSDYTLGYRPPPYRAAAPGRAPPSA